MILFLSQNEKEYWQCQVIFESLHSTLNDTGNIFRWLSIQKAFMNSSCNI